MFDTCTPASCACEHGRVGIAQLRARFAIHRARCYKCKRHIRGVRWVNCCDTRYSSCSLHVSGCGWYPVSWPWRTTVPKAPLKLGDKGRRVLHLQMILTKLGYLRLRDTKFGAGYYDEHTAKRVKQFRECHAILGCDMRKYTKRTARTLEHQVSNLCDNCVW